MELEGLARVFAEGEESQRARPKGAQLTPGSVSQLVARAPQQPAAKKAADSNEIWAEDELEADDGFDDDDGRATADYDLLYKQRVSPQDMFLGIDPTRNPGTASCEDLLIRIKLPGTKSSAEIDLEVKRARLTLRAPKHKLRIHLPKPVDDEHGSAKWVSDKGWLEVCLPVVDDLFLGGEDR